MNAIQKVSQITVDDLADYCRIAEMTVSEQNTLSNFLAVAKNLICSYTGKTVGELDDSRDFVIAVFILVQDMYDNRTIEAVGKEMNRVLDMVLGLHRTNLL